MVAVSTCHTDDKKGGCLVKCVLIGSELLMINDELMTHSSMKVVIDLLGLLNMRSIQNILV